MHTKSEKWVRYIIWVASIISWSLMCNRSIMPNQHSSCDFSSESSVGSSIGASPPRNQTFSIPATPDPFDNPDSRLYATFQNFPPETFDLTSHPPNAFLVSLAAATISPGASSPRKQVSLVEALNFDNAVPKTRRLPLSKPLESGSQISAKPKARSPYRKRHSRSPGATRKEVCNTDEELLVQEM